MRHRIDKFRQLPTLAIKDMGCDALNIAANGFHGRIGKFNVILARTEEVHVISEVSVTGPLGGC